MASAPTVKYLGFVAKRQVHGACDARYLLANPAPINSGEIDVDIGTVVETPGDRYVVNGYGGGQEYGGCVYLMHPYDFHAELSADFLRRDRTQAMKHRTYGLNGQTLSLSPSNTTNRWDVVQLSDKLVGVVLLPPDNIQVPTPGSPFRDAFLRKWLEDEGVDPERALPKIFRKE